MVPNYIAHNHSYTTRDCAHASSHLQDVDAARTVRALESSRYITGMAL
jgi:hypothetical protein